MTNNLKNTLVRIYNEGGACTQSGKGKSKNFFLEFVSPEAKYQEPLMGWHASKNTSDQVRLKFPSRELAERFAKENGFKYEVFLGNHPTFKIKSYSDNFK